MTSLKTSRRDVDSYVPCPFEEGELVTVVYLYPDGEERIPIVGDNARALADGMERSWAAALEAARREGRVQALSDPTIYDIDTGEEVGDEGWGHE